MNAIFSQDRRLGKLTTVLGKDVLVLLRFTGSDYLNGLFEYRVDCLSTEPNIDFNQVVGTHASVEINSQNHGLRHFDGIVTEAQWAGVGENGNKYQLTLRPWFWLAGRRRNQRIFHNQTVVQIIEKLLAPYSSLGSPALKVSLTADYPVLEYTVQYRESDMSFAMRLMERFGISYHFVHEAGGHTLLLTDDLTNHADVAGESRVYKPYDGHHNTEHEHFWEWHPQRRLTTGAMRLTDYNFKTPHAAMETDRVGDAVYAEGQIESYDYPGDYLEIGRGKDVVGLRTRAERGQDARHRAVGDCTSLGAGMLVTLTGDHVDGVKGVRYLCLSASHSYVSDSYGTMDGEAQKQASDGYAYSGEYVLMPDAAPLVPERKTRIPVVQGPQTAVVVGEGEIDCDEYGRILVHFHWDLEKAYSMRCRVSQNWASKGWGGMVIPRIGMEVVVEFLEGDPDKPLVTGCVYNGHNDVPYELPKHKTRSTFKTDTHQGYGFNELRFEDEKGEEEIFVHAQKDLTEKIEHNASKRVNNNDLVSVGGNKLEAVRWNSKYLIGLNYYLNVGGGQIGDVFDGISTEGLRSKAYDLNEDLAGTEGVGNIIESCSGSRISGAAQNESRSVGAAYSITVGTGATTRVGTEYNVTVGGDSFHNVSGNNSTTVGGNNLTVVDGDIVLSNQGGGLVIKESGEIHLIGSSVHIEAEGKVTVLGSKIDLN